MDLVEFDTSFEDTCTKIKANSQKLHNYYIYSSIILGVIFISSIVIISTILPELDSLDPIAMLYTLFRLPLAGGFLISMIFLLLLSISLLILLVLIFIKLFRLSYNFREFYKNEIFVKNADVIHFFIFGFIIGKLVNFFVGNYIISSFFGFLSYLSLGFVFYFISKTFFVFQEHNRFNKHPTILLKLGVLLQVVSYIFSFAGDFTISIVAGIFSLSSSIILIFGFKKLNEEIELLTFPEVLPVPENFAIEAPSKAPPPPKIDHFADHLYCLECGTKVQKDKKICPKCGEIIKIREIPEQRKE